MSDFGEICRNLAVTAGFQPPSPESEESGFFAVSDYFVRANYQKIFLKKNNFNKNILRQKVFYVETYTMNILFLIGKMSVITG
jgi:hypothetical protein